MATDVEGDWDGQDQSEVLDEDNQNPDAAGGAGNEMRTFDELVDVQDVTQAEGDADAEAALIAEELDDDEVVQLDSDQDMADFEDDDLAERMPEALDGDDPDLMDTAAVYLPEESTLDVRDEGDEDGVSDAGETGMSTGAADEVELEYAGDMDDVTNAEAQTADEVEPDNLADDDLEELGYPGEDEPAQHSQAAEEQRRR